MFLVETKDPQPISVPGFISYCAKTSQENSHRGGVCALVKNSHADSIMSADTGSTDQIWIRFTYNPKVVIGSCYIPPRDSPYFTMDTIADIQSRILSSGDKYIIIGDINSRFGPALGEADLRIDNNIPFTRLPSIDTVQHANANARDIIRLCLSCQLVPINNCVIDGNLLQSNLTFRQRDTWVSELDWCLASTDKAVLSMFKTLAVDQDKKLPSNHAIVSVDIELGSGITDEILLQRANDLMKHACMPRSIPSGRKPVRLSPRHCNAHLMNVTPPTWRSDANEWAAEITRTLYDETRIVIMQADLDLAEPDAEVKDGSATERWERLLRSNDNKAIWRAIAWNGSLDNTTKDRPSDELFKEHMETLLNPSDVEHLSSEVATTSVYIPVLDDPITPDEVHDAIQSLKPDKASGPDGIPPRVVRSMPVNWLLCVTTLFNVLFSTSTFPMEWTVSRLTMLFKKGDRMSCNNYRGISVSNVVAKLYDMVLSRRIQKWFTPLREQAGAQAGRGCQEQIVTLRLLIDYALCKKEKMFIMFIDFSKAYDKVPRTKLLMVLKKLGCGALMLGAIAATYISTQSMLGTAIITATVGVKQGFPTSRKMLR